MTGSTISDNTATLNGAGIFSVNSNPGGVLVTLTASTVSGNSLPGAFGLGGGIALGVGSTLNLIDTTVTGNHAASANGGGGIYANFGADATASGTTSVTGNTPDNCNPDNLIPGCT